MKSNHNTRILSVIIPCYNEAATIAEVIDKVKKTELPGGWQKEIIVVNDNSRNDTERAIGAIKEIDHVIHRRKNGGKGAAVKDGLRVAKGDYCIIQDADLELDPNEYPSLLAPIIKGEADSVFGYRVLANPDAPKNPVLFYGGRILSLFYNLMFGAHFKDIPACYKIFPRAYIPELLKAPSDDFVFDAVEMTRVLDCGGSVAQVPISYRPRGRKEGKKIRWQHGAYCLLAILFLRLGVHHLPLAREAPKMFRFLVTGGTSVLVNLALIYTLTEYANMWYLLSSMFSFAGSWVVNFTLHKFWTFNYEHAHPTSFQAPLHFSLGLINLGINTVLMYVLVNYVHLWYMFAQIITAGIIAIESFMVQSRFIFKKA